MAAPLALGDATALAIDAPAPQPPKNVAEAAKQFEALLIGQLLKEARGDEGGWLGSGDDTGCATAAGFAEEQFAQALAASGGLGLSARIAESLTKEAHPAAAAPPPAASGARTSR